MLKAWFNPSHIAAGFIAVLVGYTSSAVIIFQAAEAAGASPQEISSWLWALGIGMAVTSIGLSLRFRAPVLIAWSTPGGALLSTGLPGFSLNEAIGVFLFNAALITLCGLLGWFDRIMRLVPASLAGAMLAGVLLPFGLNLFGALQEQTLLVGLMLACYLAGKLVFPRYVIPVTLLVGVLVAALAGQLHLEQLNWSLAQPVWTTPAISLQALLGVGIPLFIVTMASQNVPGMTVLRANGYQLPASPLMTTTGITGLLLAPFGGYTFNLAAISAAICAGMRTLLEGWGCNVITALSEEDLAAQVDNFHAQADLLIADYHLDNDVNGVDVVQRINARRSSPLPVLLITANYSNALKLQVRELGHVILHKPVKPMKLKTAMSHLLAVSG